MEMNPEGLIVRVPYRASKKKIETFIRDHEEWICTNTEKLNRALKAQNGLERLTQEDIHRLAEEARQVIPSRVSYYAQKLGVTYGRITIRNQKTRWGSCSTKGNLNFNCLLMLAPPEVLDSVIVHELCHRKEMNHSSRFYAEVLWVFPDYLKWNKWLKENGLEIMSRAFSLK